ncbi:PIN domain nuclease, partial [Listeria monocytogenes]|nr:PIN domain nuclease [Listeria monocytogenes]
ILTLVLGYLGFRIGISRRNEFVNFVNNRNAKKRTPEEDKTEEKSKKTYKILDTSVSIDGRIADILTTGFLDGTVVIPLLVLAELQH